MRRTLGDFGFTAHILYCKVGDLRDDLPEPWLQPCFHAVEFSNPRKHWRCTRWPYG